jgi:AcrR family transcriptional regulator
MSSVEYKKWQMFALDPVQRRIHDAALRLFALHGSDRVSVRDLAEAAGVARGTIYNNVGSVDTLFVEIAAQLAAEMHERIRLAFGTTEDPAQRLATGIRLLLRRAHDEPHWGRFMCRFGQTASQLREVWYGQPMKDLVAGVESGRYNIAKEQLITAAAMIGGGVLGASLLVQEGYRGWREASIDAAELILRALGISATEARALANVELPDLPFGL